MSCPGQGQAVYRTEDLRTIRGGEHIRVNPGMYIGNTESVGLSHMLFALVARSLAEIARGHGRSVRVTLRADGSAEVADDGRGLPVSAPSLLLPTVEQCFTEFHYASEPLYTTAPNYELWGYVVANALSAELTVVAREPGSRYQHTFRRGVTHAVLQSGGPPDDRGLTVRFRPDPDIFGTAQFDPVTIRDRLRQYAFLHSGVRITFAHEASGTLDEFEYADGIREYVRHLNADRTPLHTDVIVIRGEEEGVRYEVGLQWCEGSDGLQMAFANGEFNRDGGPHITGLWTALTRTLNDFIREHSVGEGIVKGEDARSGLTAVVAVRLAQPNFGGATRSSLDNPEAERAVASGVGRFLRDYLEANREVAEVIVRNAILERDAREAASALRRKKQP